MDWWSKTDRQTDWLTVYNIMEKDRKIVDNLDRNKADRLTDRQIEHKIFEKERQKTNLIIEIKIKLTDSRGTDIIKK